MGWAFVQKGFIIVCIFCHHVKLYNKSWRKENRSEWLQPDDHCCELWHIHCGGCVCSGNVSLLGSHSVDSLGCLFFICSGFPPPPPIFFKSSWYMFLEQSLLLFIKMLSEQKQILIDLNSVRSSVLREKTCMCWVWKYPSVVVVVAHHRRWEFSHHEWLLVHP
jgi:hypothetical protein